MMGPDYKHTEGNECEIVEELLSAFYDEELNETSDAFVRTHLDSCPACTMKLDELKATVLAINSLPTEGTPENDLWPGIVAGTAASAAPVPLGSARQRAWWTKTPILIAAGLAALLIPAGAFVTGLTLSRARHVDEPAVAPEAEISVDIPDIRLEGLEGLEGAIAEAVRMAEEIARAAEEGAARGRSVQGERPRLSFSVLMDALQDEESSEIRVMAAQGLGEIGDPRAIQALSDALGNDRDDEVRRWAACRRWSAWALGEIGDPRGIQGLSDAMRQDDYGEARRWAAWALGEIGDPRGIDVLLDAVRTDRHGETRRWAAWALGEIGDSRGVPALIEALLNDSVAEVRRWSAWALGEIGDSRATEALSRAARDSNPEVRRWAIWALTEIGGHN
jgi:hypothetical protein